MIYFCGWDGGGSSTKVCVTDAGGAVTAEGVFGPLNPNGAPLTAVEATVKDCVDFLAALPGGLAACKGLTVGMAGVSSPAAANTVETAIRRCGYAGGLRLTGDCEIALAGAVRGPGAVLIAGTGSVCFGKNAAGMTFRAGGFGYLIDDAGGGYAIGRDILRAAARSMDGRIPPTCLADAVLRERNLGGPEELIAWLYAPGTGKPQIAALAPLLIPALQKNDAAALAIEETAVRELAALASAVWNKAGLTDGELALTGGVLTGFSELRERLITLLGQTLPRAGVIAPRHSASFGAAILAREAFGP